ncbi:MAG: RNA polymerase sigma factor [Acidobacteria bacterium]|jgi:RNA polymerase sigma-70 factor (ECF subfamily)|nr:RNA polymerase sigma factor [Acidobacteriota bacterium]
MTGEPVERCLEELHPASAGWALSCCRWDRDEAEEVLQMTYLKILDGRARFDERSSFKTWLFGVIRRTAAERRRSRWLRSVAGLRWRDGRPSPAPVPTPESLLGAAETSRSLRAALQALPARQREVLHLVFYQDLTVEEAARVLGISLGSARTHYHRGKAGLQERLGPFAPLAQEARP